MPSPRSDTPVAPTMQDRLARFASGLIGGPAGGHAVNPPRRRFWSPLRVILFFGLVFFAIHWLQKYPCATPNSWVDWSQYTNACYTDIKALWWAERLNEGAVPYRDHEVEYPVLTGVFMGILGRIAYMLQGVLDVDGQAGASIFYQLNAVTLFACGIAAIAVLYAIRDRNTADPFGPEPPPDRPSRPWDAMLLAAAPVILVTATVNWDLFAVALALPFFLFWQRGRPVMAGLFLGLATAAKFYPLLFAGPLLVLAVRNRRPIPALTSIATAAATWAAINAPVAALWQDSWLRFFELNSERPVDWGTGWYVLRGLTEWELEAEFVNDAYLVLFAAACLGIAALGYFAHRRATVPIYGSQASPRGADDLAPRLTQLCFLVVAAFLLFGKVWSQQYVLWLLPLAVLARPKWGMFMLWQAAELFYFFAFYGKMLQVSADGGDRGIPEWLFLTAASARWLAVAAMCAWVVFEILNPRLDAVRGLRARPRPAAPPRPAHEEAGPAPT